MKILEINLNNPNKMWFINQLGGYCIANSLPFLEQDIYEDMKMVFDSQYSRALIAPMLKYETIVQNKYWENAFVGMKISSMDDLRAIFIQSVDCHHMFISANSSNVEMWKKMFSNTLASMNSVEAFYYLFEKNKNMISSDNSFQVWDKSSIFKYGEDRYTYWVTGQQETLEIILDYYSQPVDKLSDFNMFSCEPDSILWRDI